MEQQKGHHHDHHDHDHVNMKLLEDGWFFGNTLLSSTSKSSSKIMVRCNSDPCSSSTTKQNTFVSPHNNDNHPSNMSNLLRTPSLPVSFGKDKKFDLLEDEDEDEVEDEDEARMGDLIRQAMPTPLPVPSRRLERTPSLPPCRGTSIVSAATTTKPYSGKVSDGSSIGRGDKNASGECSGVLQEKGPIAMVKLTRRASIDSSMLLPPKYTTSKGTKQSGSNSKNRPVRKQEPSNLNKTDNSKSKVLDRSKSHKTLSDLEIEELQGFKDLGFSFDNNDLSPSVTQIVPALQRRASLGSNFHEEVTKVRRPYLSEAWQQQQQQQPSSPRSAPPVPKWSDPKASSTQDMKAQIKFWARAVASNVRQEC